MRHSTLTHFPISRRSCYRLEVVATLHLMWTAETVDGICNATKLASILSTLPMISIHAVSGWSGDVGPPVPISPNEFARQLEMAKEGAPLAMYLVGYAYLNGSGTKRDAKEGLEWLTNAAEGGCAIAQLSLGLSILMAHTTEVQSDVALMWIGAAEKGGNLAALYYKGESYELGIGNIQSEVLARDCYERGARRGYARCQEKLESFERDGFNPEAPIISRAIWLARGAEQGLLFPLAELAPLLIDQELSNRATVWWLKQKRPKNPVAASTRDAGPPPSMGGCSAMLCSAITVLGYLLGRGLTF